MRVIGAWATFHREKATALYPKYGEVAIGGADFDHLLKAVVGESYLRVLRRGGSVEAARAEAVKYGNECVKRWNDRTHKSRMSIVGSYELKRWDNAGESEADAVHLRFLNLTRAAR